MELQDNVLKAFADAVNSSGDTPSDGKTFYAKVVRKDGDTVYVRLSGADESIETPAISMVEVGINDIVMVRMKAHKATIIGNISFPALTRVGEVYITLTEDGLVVGKLDPETNLPTGTHILITDEEFQLIAEDNETILAKFGWETRIGEMAGKHIRITNNGVEIYSSQNDRIALLGTETVWGQSRTGLIVDGEVDVAGGPVHVRKDTANAMVVVENLYGGTIRLISTFDANQNGLCGLHTLQGGWLIREAYDPVAGWKYYLRDKDVDKLLVGGVMQLWTGNMTVTADSTDWSELTLATLNNWNVVAVRVRCGRMYTTVMIVRSEGAAEHRVADYNFTYGGSSQTLMAEVRINWTTGPSVGIKRTLGPSDANAVELYQIMSVHGVVRAV